MTTDHHLDSPFACYTYPFLAVVPIDSIDPGGMWGYCGLTASRPSNPYIQTLESIICGWLQTNPCGVEASRCASYRGLGMGYRRTLVGSKHRGRVGDCPPRRLQTNPCGVEAQCGSCYREIDEALQTNPCGVEAAQFTRSL